MAAAQHAAAVSAHCEADSNVTRRNSPSHTILYYVVLRYTLYYAILRYTTLYYTTLHYTTLYYTILYHTILYYAGARRRDDSAAAEDHFPQLGLGNSTKIDQSRWRHGDRTYQDGMSCSGARQFRLGGGSALRPRQTGVALSLNRTFQSSLISRSPNLQVPSPARHSIPCTVYFLQYTILIYICTFPLLSRSPVQARSQSPSPLPLQIYSAYQIVSGEKPLF